jgi:CxxC motif-containing protein
MLKGSRCPRGVNWAFLKIPQILNSKQEPNFTQLLAISKYYLKNNNPKSLLQILAKQLNKVNAQIKCGM